MKLIYTSFFENFLAHSFDFSPKSLQWKYTTDIASEQFIINKIPTNADELWLFGLHQVSSSLIKIPQHEFVFSCTSDVDTKNISILCIDNWAYTISDLYDRAKDLRPFICIHESFLANLNDPRPLLVVLKKICLDKNTTQILILKEQINNVTTIRYWSDTELQKFLEASGFQVSVYRTDDLNKTYFTVSMNSKQYNQYLYSLGFTQTAKDYKQVVICRTEHSVYTYNGIDKYIENFKSLNRNSVYLNCNINFYDNIPFDNSLFLTDLIGSTCTDNVRNGIDIIEAIKVILYVLPFVVICEFQDNSDIGFRIVQAKHTGQLPQNLFLRVILSGNIDYVKFSEQNYDSSVYNLTNIRNTIKDEFVYKYIDESRFSHSCMSKVMTNEFGYYLNNPQFQKLPFDLDSISKTRICKINLIDKLIFIGDYAHKDEWDDFKCLVNYLDINKLLLNINQIICIATNTELNIETLKISSSCQFVKKHINSNDLISFIAELKNESLFILPTRGLGQPYTFLSLLLSGSRFITYECPVYDDYINTNEFSNLFIARNQVNSLIELTSNILSQPVNSYEDILNTECVLANESQVKTNKYYRDTNGYSDGSIIEKKLNYHDLSITVASPIYNTPFQYLEELLQSICCSSLVPEQWLLIDDGSKPEYSERLKVFVFNNQDKLNIRLIKQINGGVAAARNLGLKSSISKYTFNIDADDVLLPHTLMHSLVAFMCSPDLVAVGSISVDYIDAQVMPKSIDPIKNHAYWAPLGVPEAKVLSLLENQYISSCNLVDTSKINNMGGWDQQDKSTWEDWAFYSQLAWNNLRFSLMPTPGFLYRNTPGSMVKTYNQYLGRRRLIRNVPGMSRQDVKILSAMALSADPRGPSGEHKLSVLLQNTLNSRSWKITAPVRYVGHKVRLYKTKISSFIGALLK
jgi:glycosyltransferase involved in cell wall biosynthesis